MTIRGDSGTAFAALVKRVHGFWAYYQRYTKTAIHAAATAALTAFGLLIFIDPSFAWLAIASYLLPPVVLYAVGSDVGGSVPDVGRTDDSDRPSGKRATVAGGFDHDADSDGVDADADGHDADHDGVDRDIDGADADADGSDADADGADVDRDG